MKIGFVGLGKMGMNMVTRLLQDHHEVVVYNRTSEKIQLAQEKGAIPSESLSNLIEQLPTPKIIWLMLPAGATTETYVEQLATLLQPDDIVIDGGNAFYKDSMRRSEQLKQKQIHFLDAGTSGGIWGLKIGYCLMLGGNKNAFKTVEPIFKSLAPKNGYAYIGDSGSGHFVKMVHNGIEYALLQAYGEGFEIIESKKEFNVDLNQVSHLWNQGSVIRSWILELAENVFSEDQTLDAIKDYVEDSGEGRWTVAEALAQDVPAPVITLSLLERIRSRQTSSYRNKFIAALRNQFGGHAIKSTKK